MDLELRGKRAIVTGGSRGIGKQTALALAREGASVAIVARTEGPLHAAAAELAAASGSKVVAVACDTGDDASVRAMVAAVAAQLGGVDILVNCAARPAGQGSPAPKLAEITDAFFREDMNVKVMGYLRCIREVAPFMASAGGGRIINVSGLAARTTGSAVGSMRNVAVAAMTKNFADELAPQGITCVVVHPSASRTERTAPAIAAEAARRGVSEAEVERRMGQGSLLGRLVDAREIGEVIAFLASPKARIINGDAIAVGGGVPRVIQY